MLTLSIQSGGGSTRMGQDKALLPFLGQPLIQRVRNRLAHLAEEIIITTNQPQAYQFLDLPLYPDIIPGAGALGGLYTALVHARQPLVAAVACDLPFVSADLLTACREILLETGADAVIPSSERGLEPLHAVYRKETCLPWVIAALGEGKRRLIAWHDHAAIHILTPETTAQYDPHRITFWNVNTPQEFQKAEAQALAMENSG